MTAGQLFDQYCKDVRTRTFAEATYWLGQYRDLARRFKNEAEVEKNKIRILEQKNAILKQAIRSYLDANEELTKLNKPVSAWNSTVKIPYGELVRAAEKVNEARRLLDELLNGEGNG